MHSLIDGAISHSRMVLTIFVCSLLAGMVTYMNLPKEADPDIPIPIVGVTIPLQGASPEDVERLLIRPIETQISSIEGMKTYDSIANEGAAVIVLEFEMDADIDQAVLDVREKVDMAEREFPTEALEPIITELNASTFPIMTVNLYGDVPERSLLSAALDLQRILEADEGVLEANIVGEREEVLEIIVDPLKLEAYNISHSELARVVQANNQLIPAGRIDTGTGRFAVKVPGLIERAEDALNLPVRRSGDSVVTLADIGEIRRTYKDRTVTAEYNGRPAVSIEIVKRAGANILETADFVHAESAAYVTRVGGGLRSQVTADVSELIDAQLGTLTNAILTAVLLVMIISIAALGLRSALLVGLSIPSSFMLAFLVLGAYGYTINMVVMFGMIISVGILVDGAIVVVEYADRKMAEGLNKQEAYALSAKRMFWPIIASSATTLAAFVPFLFWDSMFGKFMAYLPITLMSVLISSLFMALIFLPVLGTIFGARPKNVSDELSALSGQGGDPLAIGGLIGAYIRLIHKLIDRPIMVTLAAFLTIAMIFFWFSNTVHRSESFVDLEPDQIYVYVGAQGSLSATEQYDLTRGVEQRLEHISGIRSVSLTGGTGSTGAMGSMGRPVDTVGTLLIDFHNYDGIHDGRETLVEVREALANISGVRIEIKVLQQGPPEGKDVDLLLTSHDPSLIPAEALKATEWLSSHPNMREVENTLPLPGLEWQLRVDQAQAGRFGVSVNDVGSAVQMVTTGLLVGRYRPDDALDELDIRIRFPEEARSVEALDRLRIATPQGMVAMGEFVTRVPAQQVSQIMRRDGRRVIQIRGNVIEQGTANAVIAELTEWLEAEANLNPAVNWEFGGDLNDEAEMAAFFQKAALASLFMMAIILLWEFNNFYHMLLTLSAVIISTMGVLIGIQVFLPYISGVMIGVGIIALAGIVVNNNIVLIDTFQRLQRDGRSAREAALATAGQRLRPILLTTGTTICGLMPMMFELNFDYGSGIMTIGSPGSEFWVHLATALVFGLAFSTFMTVLVTPVWLAAPEKMGNWRRRRVRQIMNALPNPAKPANTSPKPIRVLDEAPE